MVININHFYCFLKRASRISRNSRLIRFVFSNVTEEHLKLLREYLT